MNGLSGFTSQMRLTGLSGLDTESMVSQLMKAERIPLDALKQKRTMVEWRRDAYREVTSTLKGFKTKFFDIVNRSSYLLSESSVKSMTAKSSDSDVVKATATVDSRAGAYTINVRKIATADQSKSTGEISASITGELSVTGDKNLTGKKILVTLDGVTKEIALENYTDDDLQTKLQASLDAAFGSSKLLVAFDKMADPQKLTIDTIGGATKVTVNELSDGTGGLAGLGLTSGESNRISLSSSLVSLNNSLSTQFTFDGGGFAIFKINGETITASATDSLQKVFDKINNNTKANALISYDEITDEITITSKTSGAGDNLKLETVSGNFFGALKINTAAPTYEGHDAEVYINGSTSPIVRSTNNFTVNGINYSLTNEHESDTDVETITVEQETDSVIKNIKSFIEDYNNLIENLNGKVTESFDREYKPLTDEQKEDMEESDIEKWEKKAKTGLLRNDSILQSITLAMRKALYEKVEGTDLSLKDIGIQTISYAEKGKLHLDEAVLKDALLKKPDEVTKLLNGVSPENPHYSRNFSPEQKLDRYNKSGVFQRLSDIVEDNITTSRNAEDKKGFLIEKAGIEGDTTFSENLLNDEMDDYGDRIDKLIDKLIRKEENYYQKFSRLETMLNQMNQQSAWLASQFGGGQ